MKISFTKCAAAGNDFIIIDNKSGELDPHELDYSLLARTLCRRSFSVGADGLLVLESSGKAGFKMRVINPDGSEVGMCGNGARCSALYASKCGWGAELEIETLSGTISAQVNGENVKLRMGNPSDIRLEMKLGIGGSVLIAHYINTGVPHVVHIVKDLEGYEVDKMGRKIREHSLFAPSGTNADFVSDDIKNDTIMVRTYERGVEGETLACGTGVVASAAVAGLLGYVKSPVHVMTKSGDKMVVYYKEFTGKVSDVYLEGTARIVYEGKTVTRGE